MLNGAVICISFIYLGESVLINETNLEVRTRHHQSVGFVPFQTYRTKKSLAAQTLICKGGADDFSILGGIYHVENDDWHSKIYRIFYVDRYTVLQCLCLFTEHTELLEDGWR